MYKPGTNSVSSPPQFPGSNPDLRGFAWTTLAIQKERLLVTGTVRSFFLGRGLNPPPPNAIGPLHSKTCEVLLASLGCTCPPHLRPHVFEFSWNSYRYLILIAQYFCEGTTKFLFPLGVASHWSRPHIIILISKNSIQSIR